MRAERGQQIPYSHQTRDLEVVVAHRMQTGRGSRDQPHAEQEASQAPGALPLFFVFAELLWYLLPTLALTCRGAAAAAGPQAQEEGDGTCLWGSAIVATIAESLRSLTA